MVSFTIRDSISILSFLESYNTSCDHSHVNEGLAIQILPYVLGASPKQTLIAYMRHHFVSYPKAISNETIIQTQDVVKKLHQLPNKRASDFAYYIPSQTNRCDSAYRPINQIDIFTMASPTRSVSRPPIIGPTIPISISSHFPITPLAPMQTTKLRIQIADTASKLHERHLHLRSKGKPPSYPFTTVNNNFHHLVKVRTMNKSRG